LGTVLFSELVGKLQELLGNLVRFSEAICPVVRQDVPDRDEKFPRDTGTARDLRKQIMQVSPQWLCCVPGEAADEPVLPSSADGSWLRLGLPR
jgi:hypothetical protein